jgi:hypothetical protein
MTCNGNDCGKGKRFQSVMLHVFPPKSSPGWEPGNSLRNIDCKSKQEKNILIDVGISAWAILTGHLCGMTW